MNDQTIPSESKEDDSEFALAAYEDWLEATEVNAAQEWFDRMRP
jgi:hypothetical protein